MAMAICHLVLLHCFLHCSLVIQTAKADIDLMTKLKLIGLLALTNKIKIVPLPVPIPVP